MKKKYKHKEEEHNLEAPGEIVPEIIKLLNPKSVVDVGCGIGTFLYCFKERGITDVLGVDGKWANKELLGKHLAVDEFIEVDLEKGFQLSKKFDLAICLEVAEHIHEQFADKFVENLVAAGRVVLFSAAIPLQGGQNHYNEQWLSYWEKKFLKHGMVIQDVLRPLFWNNPKVFTWYKQNMVLFTPKDFRFSRELKTNDLRDVVHYELYLKKAKEHSAAIKGELSPIKYLGYLFISIIGRKNIIRLKQLRKKKTK